MPSINDTNTIVTLFPSAQRKGAWKVWVHQPGVQTGFLRLGFAWKTKTGALKAAQKAFPGVTIGEMAQ